MVKEVHGITFEQLDAVRQEVADHMPVYNVKRVDPFEALENKMGNCFAKAAIVSGLLVVRHNTEPAVAYSERLHGADWPGIMLATKSKKMEHITVLASEPPSLEGRVLSLCFGVEGKSGKRVVQEDLGDILDYNEADVLAAKDDIGGLYATNVAQELGLYIGDWREGVNRYLHAIDRKAIDTDALVERVANTFASSEDLKKVG